MKWRLFVLVFALCGNSFAQPEIKDCREVSSLIDYIGKNYYWGSPAWLTKMDSVIQLCPNSAEAWGDKAMVYALRGDFITWNELMVKAIERDPSYYLGNRAWHRMRYLQDYSGALKDLMKLDTTASFYTRYVSDVHSHILIAICKEGLGDWTGALSSYNFAIERQTNERGREWVGSL